MIVAGADPGAVTRDPITIILMGEPVPFARMRLTRIGGHFIPTPQRNAAAALKIAAGNAMRATEAVMLDEAVALDLHAEFAIPGSWSKKKRMAAIAGLVRPTKRPDIDNLYKLAADALTGIVYRDDALVIELRARKVFGLQPKLVVTVRPAGTMTIAAGEAQ